MYYCWISKATEYIYVNIRYMYEYPGSLLDSMFMLRNIRNSEVHLMPAADVNGYVKAMLTPKPSVSILVT